MSPSREDVRRRDELASSLVPGRITSDYTRPCQGSGLLTGPLDTPSWPFKCRVCLRPCLRDGHPNGCGLPPWTQIEDPIHPCACGTVPIMAGQVFADCCPRIHVAHALVDHSGVGAFGGAKPHPMCSCGWTGAGYLPGDYGDEGAIRAAQARHVNLEMAAR